jgi:protein associated with RNAse G/E
MNKFRSFFKKRRVFIASILYAIFLLQPTLALAEGETKQPESIYTRLATQALPVHAQLKNIFESVDVDLETQAKKPSHDLKNYLNSKKEISYSPSSITTVKKKIKKILKFLLTNIGTI